MTGNRLGFSILSCTLVLLSIEFGDCTDPLRFIPYASPFWPTIQRRAHSFRPIRDHLLLLPVASPPQAPDAKQIEANPTHHAPGGAAPSAASANISIDAVDRQNTLTQSNYDTSNATQTIFQANTPSNYDVHAAQDAHRFESLDFWQVKDRPVLANGHIGLVPFGDFVFMNGLYNGVNVTSHRARVPNYANVLCRACSSHWLAPDEAIDARKLSKCTYTLDTFNGVFSSRTESVSGQFSVEHIQYVHRYHEMAIVNRVRMQRNQNASNLNGRRWDFNWSFNFSQSTNFAGGSAYLFDWLINVTVFRFV